MFTQHVDLYSGDPDGLFWILSCLQPTSQIKLPAYWTSQPRVWFEQAEAQFHIRQNTADATKHNYILVSTQRVDLYNA